MEQSPTVVPAIAALRLVAASEADADLGFMARMLALQYVRRNGPLTLAMTAGVNNKLPYGNIPRLLLAWVCTEAVRSRLQDRCGGYSILTSSWSMSTSTAK